jgi:hypothetical protein
MQSDALKKYDAEISINKSEVKKHCTVRLDSSWGMSVDIPEREGITIYVFNKLMISRYVTSALPREENYALKGPKLGLYHDTADPREGPYINHWVEQLKIQIKYDMAGIHFSIHGEAREQAYGNSSLNSQYRKPIKPLITYTLLTSGSNRSLRSLGRAKARPLTKR